MRGTERKAKILLQGIPLLVLLIVVGCVSAQGTDRRAGGSLILTMEKTQTIPGTSIVHLYNYTSGNPEEIWSTNIEGWVLAVSLNDINSDGEPEIVVMNRHIESCTVEGDCYNVGVSSLLIYEYVSETYELVFNETGSTTIVRAHMIDYYNNGTEYLLGALSGRFCLIGYESGELVIKKRLPHIMGNAYEGLDVGDVNNDGKTDIVYTSKNGFTVLENTGEDKYSTKSVKGKMHLDEIRIGDVDRDGLNEIVTVGPGYNFLSPGPSLSVWKKVDGEYKDIWTYYGKGISNVDISDVDGDGVNEIVTGSEGGFKPGACGVSIWKFQPEIVYKGTVLEPGNYFYRLWEEMDRTTQVTHDLSLRVSILDESGKEKIVAVAVDSNLRAYLYLVERDQAEFKSRRIPLWSGRTTFCPTLDIWPPAKIDEFYTVSLVVLIMVIVQTTRRAGNKS